MKECSICKVTKDYVEFGTLSANKSGFRPMCKTCTKEKDLKYYRSIPGIITQMYADMKKRTKLKKFKEITFSKQEFQIWLLEQENFNDLYNEWCAKNYNRHFKPSVDRIDSTIKSYEFYNMQIITTLENSLKQ